MDRDSPWIREKRLKKRIW